MPPEISSVPSTTLFAGLQRSIHRANDICHRWSGGLRNLQSAGTEFVLHYEVTRYLSDTLNDAFDFDLPPIHAQNLREESARHKVSRNTKRRYLVARSGSTSIAFVRVQRFECVDYFVAEVKGAARAVQKYDYVKSAVVVGVISSPCNPIADTLRSAYERIGETFRIPPISELVLDVPNEAMQRQLVDTLPIMMALVTKEG